MEVTLVKATTPRQIPMSGSAMSTSAPATGNWVPMPGIYTTYQVIAAAAATVVIEVSNEDGPASNITNPVLLGTITLAGAGSDGFAANAAWKWVRARTTVATAATTCIMGG